MRRHGCGRYAAPVSKSTPAGRAQSWSRGKILGPGQNPGVYVRVTTSSGVWWAGRAKGITRVRPLEGGIDAWLADNLPSVTESLVNKPVVL